MLHLENFFEKSFALLLTTPSIEISINRTNAELDYKCFVWNV